MHTRVIEVLASLGIENPRPLQIQVLAWLYREHLSARSEHRHALIHLPTSYGKSAIFMALPRLIDQPVLIIYPLVSLIADQERRFKESGLRVLSFTGKMTKTTKHKKLAQVLTGRVDAVLSSPEFLQSPWAQDCFPFSQFAYACFDEAHTISQWGQSFRPQQLSIALFLRSRGINRYLALSGSFTPTMVDLIEHLVFRYEPYEIFEASLDRANISYELLQNHRPLTTLRNLIQNQKLQLPLIVFCKTRRTTEFVAQFLHKSFRDIEVKWYHAGLENEEKLHVAQWFLAKSRAILSATCAFGMGVDKKNVRSIVHLSLPDSIESYLQESGRAGRDGQPATSIIIHNPQYQSQSPFIGILHDNKPCIRHFLLDGLFTNNKLLLDNAATPKKTCCSNCRDRNLQYSQLYPSLGLVFDCIQKYGASLLPHELSQKLNEHKDFACYKRSDIDAYLENLLGLKVLKKSRSPLNFKRIVIADKKCRSLYAIRTK